MFPCMQTVVLIIGDVPILTTEDKIVSQPAKILNFLRKQVGGSF